MRVLANVPTLDGYDSTTTIEDREATLLTYIVGNNSVIAQFRASRRETGGEGSYSPDVLITPEKNIVPLCNGAKFRSAESGKPARVIAFLLGRDDPQLGAGIPFLTGLSASGGLSKVGLIAADTLAADVALTKAVDTEASPLTLFTLPAIDFDGLTPHLLQVYFPGWVAEALGNGSLGLNLWDDTPADLGRVWTMETGGKASSGFGGIFGSRRFTPPDAVKTYRIRGWCSGASVTLRAGAGGPGVYGPAYYRLLTDPVS